MKEIYQIIQRRKAKDKLDEEIRQYRIKYNDVSPELLNRVKQLNS